MNNNMIQDMKEALDNHGWDYSPSVIESIARDWATAKADLYSVLGLHAAWIDDINAVVIDGCIDKLPNFDKLVWFARKWFSGDAARFIRNIKSSKLTGDEWGLDDANAAYNLNLRKGMRSTAAIQKIAKKEGLLDNKEYLRDFSALADEMREAKEPQWIVVSIHPVDYLLMSNGDSWQSCHNIEDADDPGCYSAGTVSYMLDSTSMIVYGLRKADYPYLPEKPFLAKKHWRQVFSYEDETLMQSRLYPQACDSCATSQYEQIRHYVQAVISVCTALDDAEKDWLKVDNHLDYIVDGYGALNYPDWHPGCPGSSHVTVTVPAGKKPAHITVGHAPRCICCGETYEETESIICESCRGTVYYCEHCGERIDEYNAIYIEGYGYCCNDCVTYCEHCGEYHLESEMVNTADGYVCRSCFEDCYTYVESRDNYYLYDDCVCDVNGNAHHVDDQGETWEYCYECGEVIPMNELVEHDGHLYCSTCVPDLDEESEVTA